MMRSHEVSDHVETRDEGFAAIKDRAQAVMSCIKPQSLSLRTIPSENLPMLGSVNRWK